MVGLSAARIYNFDVEALGPIVERIGPPEGTFTGETPIEDARYTELDYAEGAVFSKELERRFRARIAAS